MRVAIALVIFSICSFGAAKANNGPAWVGEDQEGFKAPRRFVKSNADWSTVKNKVILRLRAAKEAIPEGSSQPPDGSIAVAAAILDFNNEDPKGVQVNFLGFTFVKKNGGILFKETTDPIARVEYSTVSNPGQYQYKTLPHFGNQFNFNYSAQQLTSLGLDPATTLIHRFAAVAKPKWNKYVDDYAVMEIEEFRFHHLNNPSLDLEMPFKDLQIRHDGDRFNVPRDQLLNGA